MSVLNGGDRDYYYFDPNFGGNEPNTGISPTQRTINGDPFPTGPSLKQNNDLNKIVSNNSTPVCYGQWKRSPSTSITETPEKSGVKVYPNPFKHEITLKTNEIEKGRVKVTNMQGQTIWEGYLDVTRKTIKTKGWKPGAYLIRIIGNKGQTMMRKMVKTK
jgi:hypothetical protein